MKKFLLLFFLFSAGSIAAQNTVVSATVVDSDLVAWANGTWRIVFRPNPNLPNLQYNINGVPLAPSVMDQRGSLDTNGAFNVTVYNNNVVSPAGSGWTVTLCPLASAPCGTFIIATNSSSMNISSIAQQNIPPARFTPGPGAYGYFDKQAQISIGLSAQYWNVNLSQFRFWNGYTWVAQGGGGGGGTPPAGAVQELQVNAGGGALGATTGMTWSPTGALLNNPNGSIEAQFLVANTSLGVMPGGFYSIDYNYNTGTSTLAANLLACSAGSGTVDTCPINATSFIGIATGLSGGISSIAVNGATVCIFDNAPVYGDFVSLSTITAGQCHDTGQSRLPIPFNPLVGTVFNVIDTTHATVILTGTGSSNGAAAAGVTTNVQYNSNGAFAADNGLTYTTPGTLNIGGPMNAGTPTVTIGPQNPVASSWTLNTESPSMALQSLTGLTSNSSPVCPLGPNASLTTVGCNVPTGPAGPPGVPGPPGGSLSYPGVISDNANGLNITGNLNAATMNVTDKGGQLYNLMAYGAVSDAASSVQCWFGPDLPVPTGTRSNLRCTDAPFNCTYINSNAAAGHPLTISIQGGSSATIQSLVTTISSCTDSSNIVLATAGTATPTVYGSILAAGTGNGTTPNSTANSVWSLTGTVVTGATATGVAGQYVTLSGFNNGCTGTTAQVVLTGTNTIPTYNVGAINNAVFNGGTGCTAVPTSANCVTGTATCTGTITWTGGTLQRGNGYYTGSYVTTATGCSPTANATLSIFATRENGGSVWYGTDLRSFIANEGAGYTVGCNVYPTVTGSDNSVYFTVTAVSGTWAIWGTDNYTAMTNWMAACGGTRNCLIPYGNYLINVQTTGVNVSAHQINVPPNTKITMDRQGAIYWVGNGHQSGQLFAMNAGDNIEFEGLHTIGESRLNRIPDSGTAGNAKSIMGANATYNVTVRNSTFEYGFGHGGIQTFCNVCTGMTFVNNRCHHNNNTCANVSMGGQVVANNILTLDNGFEVAGYNTKVDSNLIIAGGGISMGGQTSGGSFSCGTATNNMIQNNVNSNVAFITSEGCVNLIAANNTVQGFWNQGFETGCQGYAACQNTSFIGNIACGRQGSGGGFTMLGGYNHKLLSNTVSPQCGQSFGLYSNTGPVVSVGNMWAGTSYDIEPSTGGQIQAINDTVLTGKWSTGGNGIFVSPSTLIVPGNAGSSTPSGGIVFLSGNGAVGPGPYLTPKSVNQTFGYNSIFMPQDFPTSPATWTPAAVTASTCAEQTVAVPGLVASHAVQAVPPGVLSTGNHVWIGAARVSSAGNAAVLFCADATGGTPNAGTWLFRQ